MRDGDYLDLEFGVASAGVTLRLDKSIDDRTPGAGWDVVYTVTLTNDGAGSYDSSTGVRRVDGLRLRGSTELHITAGVDLDVGDGTIIVNRAVISASDQVELDPSDGEAAVALAVAGADLAVEKEVDNLLLREGETFVYTVTVSKKGTTATVVVSDALPAGVSHVSSDGVGAHSPVTGPWTVGNLEEGASASLHITCLVDSGTRGSYILNRASISASSRVDPYPDDDADTVGIAAQHPDAVMITVTPGEGGSLTYTDTHGRQAVVQVLPGAVTETVTLVFTPVLTQTDVGRPCSAGHAFALAIYGADELLAGSGFNTPVYITIHYSEGDVAGLLETALELDYWSGRAWENAACGDGGRRPEDNWICVPIQHLSDFVLYGPRIPSGGVTLPGPARRPRCWGLALVAVLGSLGLALAPRRE